MGGGILGVALHKGELYFLFGLENKMDDTPGFADFGGGQNNNETQFQTAIREGCEELNGFFGNINDVRKRVKRNNILNIKHKSYLTCIYLTEYDEKLPIYFNNNFNFLQRKLPDVIKDTENGLLEKQKIKWFSSKELTARKNDFRQFYQEIVDKIITKLPLIKQKVKMKSRQIKQTRKNKKSRKDKTRKKKSR